MRKRRMRRVMVWAVVWLFYFTFFFVLLCSRILVSVYFVVDRMNEYVTLCAIVIA